MRRLKARIALAAALALLLCGCTGGRESASNVSSPADAQREPVYASYPPNITLGSSPGESAEDRITPNVRLSDIPAPPNAPAVPALYPTDPTNAPRDPVPNPTEPTDAPQEPEPDPPEPTDAPNAPELIPPIPPSPP